MRLVLTPDMIERAYELLRATPPFRGWKLPEGDEVGFHVTRHQDRYACYVFKKGTHHIIVSQQTARTLQALLMHVAHEMTHMRQELLGRKRDQHGDHWKRMRDQVCRWHGFDPGVF